LGRSRKNYREKGLKHVGQKGINGDGTERKEKEEEERRLEIGGLGAFV